MEVQGHQKPMSIFGKMQNFSLKHFGKMQKIEHICIGKMQPLC